MFGIGGFELFLIVLFGFLIVGPDKLPALAKTVGKAIAKFREKQEEVSGSLNMQSFISNDPNEAIKNPLDVIEKVANSAAAGSAGKSAGASQAQASAGNGADKDADGGAGKSGASASGASNNAGAGASSTGTSNNAGAPNGDTFAERKARYERERAQKKAAAKQATDASDDAAGGKTPGTEGTEVR